MNIKNKTTIVIKIGTTSLVDDGKLSQELLHSLAEKIKQHQNTHSFVIVTSGAVSLGVKDFSKYASAPFGELMPDFFVPEDTPLPDEIKNS